MIPVYTNPLNAIGYQLPAGAAPSAPSAQPLPSVSTASPSATTPRAQYVQSRLSSSQTPAAPDYSNPQGFQQYKQGSTYYGYNPQTQQGIAFSNPQSFGKYFKNLDPNAPSPTFDTTKLGTPDQEANLTQPTVGSNGLLQAPGGAPAQTPAPTPAPAPAAEGTPQAPVGTPSTAAGGGAVDATGTEVDATGEPLDPKTAYLQQVANDYMNSFAISPEEQAAQKQVNDITAAENNGIAQLQGGNGSTIVMSAQTAQEERQAAAAAAPVQNNLNQLEAQREANIQGGAARLQYVQGLAQLEAEPIGYGGSVVNGVSGKTVVPAFGGASATATIDPSVTASLNLPVGTPLTPVQIQGYLEANGITPGKYDLPGAISAIQEGYTAKQIISGEASKAGAVADATAQTNVQTNPLTGQQYTFQPTVPGAPAPGAAAAGKSAAPITNPDGSPSQYTSFVKNANSPTIYGITTTGQKVPFASPDAFIAAGGNPDFSNVKTIGGASSSSLPSTPPPLGSTSSSSGSTSVPASVTASYPSAGYTASSQLDNATLTYLQTGSVASGTPPYGPLGASAIQARAQQLVPGFNPEVAKANGDALSTLVKSQAGIAVSTQKLEGDLNQLASIADEVNKKGIPNLDDWINGKTTEYTNNPLLVQYKNLLTTARGDYAVINAGGGAPDDKNQAAGESVIPSGQNSDVYRNGVLATAHAEAQRKLSAQQQQIEQLSKPGQVGQQAPAGSSSTPASSFDFSIQ